MTIVREPLAEVSEEESVALRVDRATLAKRRWRGVAEDGREFGFDLEEPLRDGAIIHREPGVHWIVAQQAEPVLEISLAEIDAQEAARRGWMLGNLHFAVELKPGKIRVADDPAIQAALFREGIAFERAEKVFHPLRSHGHGH